MQLHLRDETAPLISVLIGRADQMGSLPSLTDLYDPKSKAHLLAGTYPKEADLIAEINALKNVLEKHGVKVFQPDPLKDCNQIFARDLGFVIDDLFVRKQPLEFLNSLGVGTCGDDLGIIKSGTDPNKKMIPKKHHITSLNMRFFVEANNLLGIKLCIKTF